MLERLTIHPILADIMRACGMWRDRDHVESQKPAPIPLVTDECRCIECTRHGLFDGLPTDRLTVEHVNRLADYSKRLKLNKTSDRQ